MPRRIFGPNNEEVREDGEKFTVVSSAISNLRQMDYY
jgi:hypothetical protein